MSNRAIASQSRNVQRKIPEQHYDNKQQTRLQAQPSNAPGQVQLSPKMGKLSISDAIGLITIRLSKLEEFMVRMEGNPTTNISDSNTLLMSLVTRVNSIESYISTSTPEDESQTYSSIQQDDPNSWDKHRETIINDLHTFKSDVDDIRKLVIKLQTASI
jgi:hypothetical protein